MGSSIEALMDYAHGAWVEAEAERVPTQAEIRRAEGEERRRLQLLRGSANERRVLRVLTSFPRPSWFTGVRAASSLEDAKGADLIVFVEPAARIWLQVKSSDVGAQQFLRRGQELGVPLGRFALVVVVPTWTDRELFDNTLRIIEETRAASVSSHR